MSAAAPAPIIQQEFTRDQFAALLRNKQTDLVVKVGAEWCGPCKKMEPIFHSWHERSNGARVQFIMIDVDECFDLYAHWKRTKIAPAIPTLMYFRRDNHDLVPDEVVVGADPAQINAFFARISAA